jgi:TRAP-type uncharacterized transport system fused permease subunit
MAKATVPFVFAYAPVMLIMVDDFTWGAFFFTTITCAIGVLCLGIGLTGYCFTRMGVPSQVILVFSSLLMIAPSVMMTGVGAAIAAPVLVLNWMRARKAPAHAEGVIRPG